jgi:hypothetical protein
VRESLSLGRRILFSALVFGFVLLCTEAMLQVFYRATAGSFLFERAQPPIFEEDEHRCYRVKPNLEYRHSTNEFSISIYTNSHGFRTSPAHEEVAYERRPGVARVMFLGPSFAFGWGSEYEESYAYLVVAGLRRLGHDVELINVGTPAQGTPHQLCWLAREGYRYRPDVIVQTDYGDIGAFEPACREDLTCPVVEDGSLYSKPPTLRSRLVAAAKSTGLVFYGYYILHAFDRAPAPGADGGGKELHGPAAHDAPPSAAQAAENYREHVRFVRGVLGDAVDVAFVYLPLSYVVHPQDAGRWWARGAVDPEGDRRRLAEAVSLIGGQGLVAIDPTPRLIAAGESERMYYWLDIHLTPAGNRVVADVAIPVLDGLLRARASRVEVTPSAALHAR